MPDSTVIAVRNEAQRGQGPLLPGLISGRRRDARWPAGGEEGRIWGKVLCVLRLWEKLKQLGLVGWVLLRAPTVTSAQLSLRLQRQGVAVCEAARGSCL